MQKRSKYYHRTVISPTPKEKKMLEKNQKHNRQTTKAIFGKMVYEAIII